jgi:hypothetical protein
VPSSRAGRGHAVGEAGPDGGDVDVEVSQRADDQGLTVRAVALVEDDDRLGPGGLGVQGLVGEVQVPRWISAMSLGPPKFRPAKSAASQPLVEARGGVRLMSTGITGPVTSPLPLLVKVPVS